LQANSNVGDRNTHYFSTRSHQKRRRGAWQFLQTSDFEKPGKAGRAAGGTLRLARLGLELGDGAGTAAIARTLSPQTPQFWKSSGQNWVSILCYAFQQLKRLTQDKFKNIQELKQSFFSGAGDNFLLNLAVQKREPRVPSRFKLSKDEKQDDAFRREQVLEPILQVLRGGSPFFAS